MHIDPPADLQAWFDAHHTDLLKAVGTLRTFDGDDASRVELIKKFTSDGAFQSRYETELLAAVKTLEAPDNIQKQLASFRDALHQQWSKFSAHDKEAVTSLVNGLSATTAKEQIVRQVANTVGTGKVSAQAAASMVHGIAPLLANTPWWCFVCYVVPIWGLICITLKRCRGGVATTSTAAVS